MRKSPTVRIVAVWNGHVFYALQTYPAKIPPPPPNYLEDNSLRYRTHGTSTSTTTSAILDLTPVAPSRLSRPSSSATSATQATAPVNMQQITANKVNVQAFDGQGPKNLNSDTTITFRIPKNKEREAHFLFSNIELIAECMSELTELLHEKRRNADLSAQHLPPEKKNSSTILEQPIHNGSPRSPFAGDDPQAESLWCTVQRRKRRRSLPTAEGITEPTIQHQRPVKETVILKPTCKKNVQQIHSKDVQRAISNAGIHINKDISVHVHSKTNTVAISTTNPLLTNKLLSIKNIPLGPEEEPAEMTPYKALSMEPVPRGHLPTRKIPPGSHGHPHG